MAMISDTLARYVDELRWEAIPGEIVAHAKHLILDAVGIAFASTTYEFAQRTLNALYELGDGDNVVIGFDRGLPLRDAVLMNGLLIHGLDFDDTHLIGVVHATASCFPCALGVAARRGRSGRDLLLAYVAGMEVSARLGAVAKGELNQIGFHPTGVIAAFASALVAGRLEGLTVEQLAMAQGIALSMASGTREYSSDGAWTKRLHPGWAGGAGITAAALARRGFVAPRAAYEGRFGFYATHLGIAGQQYDLAMATAGLSKHWELPGVAIKPFPVCQYNIACIDAALVLRARHGIEAASIASIQVLIPQHAVIEVCEPVAMKRRPASSYAASFSVQFAVACALLRGRFGLREVELYADKVIHALADRVEYAVDSQSGYPRHFSAEVIVTMKDGSTYRQREQINRGAPERPVGPSEIVDKFMENACLAISPSRARAVAEAVLKLDEAEDSAHVAAALR